MRRLVPLIALFVAAPARADDYDDLGKFERQEVDAVLAERGLEVDRAPEGKIVGRVIVATRDVFSKRDGRFLRFFNLFHWTTAPRVVEREVLLRPRMTWNRELVDETLRNIRDPLVANVVVALPVKSSKPGAVDLLIVTRDLWSIRLNSRFEGNASIGDLLTFNVSGDNLTLLSFSLSENNLLGRRKKLAAIFFMDQGAISVGPTYIDPNIRGTRLTLTSSLRAIFARDGQAFEGTSSGTQLAYPLWSLRSRWGASVEAGHYDSIVRQFAGTEIRTYDNPDTAAVEEVPRAFAYRRFSTEAGVVRSFPGSVVQRLSAGHELDMTRASLMDDAGLDPVTAAAFERDVFPRSEVASALFVRYSVFTPEYVAYRDLDTFDLREDYRLGPSFNLQVSQALELIGSDTTFRRWTGGLGWAMAFGKDGIGRASFGVSGREQDGALIDVTVSQGVYLASPKLAGRRLRLAGDVSFDRLLRETANRFLTLGGDNGLRGYLVNQFIGEARLAAHLELRTMPLHIAFMRLGAVAFWDFGHAAPTPSQLDLHHDAGLGARLLIPQLNPIVMRFDWAIPFHGPAAGFPGRFTLGVTQAF